MPEATAPQDAESLARRLYTLDEELDAVRRRLFLIAKGLAHVEDPDREVASLEGRLRDLGDQFVVAYREWQARERELEAE